MADPKENVQSALLGFVKSRMTVTVFPATVKSFDSDSNTITVEDSDGNELFDIQLASLTGEVSLSYLPVIGSTVLLADVGNSGTRYVVVAYSNLERIEFKNEFYGVSIEADGVRIANQVDTLKNLLNDVLTAIKAITVTSAAPGSPTSVPLNFAAFDLISTRVNNLLK